jgi:hypothetical protein
LRLTGVFDGPTKSRTKQWLNDNWDLCGASAAKKLNIKTASFERGSFEALQRLLNHLVPGTSEPVTGLDDMGTARTLHKLLNKHAGAAGLGASRLNLGTSKHEPLPPAFTSSQSSVKALQNYLNSMYS